MDITKLKNQVVTEIKDEITYAEGLIAGVNLLHDKIIEEIRKEQKSKGDRASVQQRPESDRTQTGTEQAEEEDVSKSGDPLPRIGKRPTPFN